MVIWSTGSMYCLYFLSHTQVLPVLLCVGIPKLPSSSVLRRTFIEFSHSPSTMHQIHRSTQGDSTPYSLNGITSFTTIMGSSTYCNRMTEGPPIELSMVSLLEAICVYHVSNCVCIVSPRGVQWLLVCISDLCIVGFSAESGGE